NLDENIQKIIKEQVKEQVKVKVSKILPNIEKTVNGQLEAKVLTRSSNSSKTSYVVAADLLEIKLKKILIEKMESNKSIHRSDEQRNLYKALVEAYESDKIILDTYGDTVTLKRCHDDADKDDEPFAGSESARDVYSKRRIITVTELQIVEWHNYKHLDWITVRRGDDKLYKFKEGDFKRLRIQDIEDMLLLLHRHPTAYRDLQLGVKSYQKKLNLTKPDTYRSDLKRKEAYTTYSNPKGFINQNKDKQNKLMRIDELHKFSDETLNDVRTALGDRLKVSRMKYLPQAIWRRSDRERAATMIHAIDKQLKTRRIMRSLEKFVGRSLRIRRTLKDGGEDKKNVNGIAKELRKLHREGINNATNSVTVVAVLFATVAFAAIFTGDDDDNGMAVVHPRVSFKIFFSFNAIALFTSLAAMVVQITLVRGETKPKEGSLK
nr:At3G12360-like protein [Tanacetum cinerariifolium]